MMRDERSIRRLTVFACTLGLLGLALMAWSLIAPSPISIVFAMSIGQLVGTLSLFLYIGAVIAELRRTRLFDGGRRPTAG